MLELILLIFAILILAGVVFGWLARLFVNPLVMGSITPPRKHHDSPKWPFKRKVDARRGGAGR